MAGQGETHTLEVDKIQVIKCWFNVCGNPSYVFHMDNDDMYYLCLQNECSKIWTDPLTLLVLGGREVGSSPALKWP